MSLVVERALRYARLRALMSCLISRFTQGLSEGLIRTSLWFEATVLQWLNGCNAIVGTGLMIKHKQSN